MGLEIERKFIVSGDSWRRTAGAPVLLRQGYISCVPERVVRVRVAGTKGFLTVKGLSNGISRAEFEYEIPLQDAAALLSGICERPLIEKNRYAVEFGGLTWEIDEFLGENAGLVIAEVELDSEARTVAMPSWAGPEVSRDPRYFNSNLFRRPYSRWENEG